MKWSNMNTYELEQKIKETNEELTVTIKLKILKNKNGMKYIKEMFEKQQSPVITILGKLERERKQDIKNGKYSKPYYIEGEISKH